MDVNAIIANIGNGTVSTGNISTGDIQQNNVEGSANKEEFIRLLNELKRQVDGLDDKTANEAIEIIQEETKKESWNKKIVNFMLDSLQKTGVTLAAQGLVAVATKAMELLPLI